MAKDVELVFGASNESFTQIKKDLDRIIDQIERSGTTKLKFSVDTKSTSTAAKQINDLGASLKAVSQSSVVGVAASFDKISASVSKIKDSGKDVSKLKESFEKLSVAKAAFDKAPTSSNLDAYRAQRTAVNALIDSFKDFLSFITPIK